MPANFIGREELGGTAHPRRRGRERTAKDLPRRGLLYLSALVLIGVAGTLALTGHTDGWVELAPLAISALGILAIGNVLYEPDRSARGLLWVTSILLAIGGCYGIYIHIDQNLDEARAIEPTTGVFDAIFDSIDATSALIAPALLVVAAALAIFGSALDHTREEAEVDSLIAQALAELDERET